MMATFASSLSQLRVNDAIDHNQVVVTIRLVDPVEKALKILKENNITSAPVVDESQNVVGFIDILDIVALILKVSDSKTTKDLLSIFQKEERFATWPVSKIERSSRNIFQPIDAGAPLREAIQLFSKGIRRIPVIENGSIINVFTQSQFIKFLEKNIHLVDEIRGKSCMDLDIGTHEKNKLKVVTLDTVAIEAFKIMHENGLSAVAVNDDEEKLHCQLSATDLKGISTELVDSTLTFASLDLPIGNFMKVLDESQPDRKAGFLVWCLPGTSFENVVHHITKNSVHRIYLIDNYVNLWGVVSLTDVCKAIVDHVLTLKK